MYIKICIYQLKLKEEECKGTSYTPHFLLINI